MMEEGGPYGNHKASMMAQNIMIEATVVFAYINTLVAVAKRDIQLYYSSFDTRTSV